MERDRLQPIDALGAFRGEIDVEAEDREEQIPKGIVGGVARGHDGHKDQAAEHQRDFGEDHALFVAEGIADGKASISGIKRSLASSRSSSVASARKP